MVKKRRGKRRGQSAAFMRSINPNLKRKRKKSNSTKLKSYTMARKKRRSSSRKKRSSSVLGINTANAIAAMLYGAGRQKVSNLTAPYTSKIPLGSISDEVGMLAGATLLKKYAFKKAGVLRDALTAGQTIELARIGEALINGEVKFGAMSNSNSGNGYVFA